MPEQITIHQKDDYIWTLRNGVLTGWKISEDGIPVQMAHWERDEALEELRHGSEGHVK